MFIAIAKAVHVVLPSEAKALALVGVVAGTLGVLAIAALFARLGTGASSGTAVLGTALAITAPLYWFTANRPLSDMAGLAAAIAVQVLILRSETPRDLAVASFCAALTVGLRSQVFWLTAPSLMWRLGARGSGLDRRESASVRKDPAPNARLLVPVLVAYVAGALVWAVPLVVLSGGPRGYWRAVFSQGTEDLSGIRMLWTTPTVRESIDALYYAFVAPWATWPLATIVLLLAALGLATLWRRDRWARSWLAIAFVPYLLFDLVFQETFTSRYALPLVIPIAFLAATGARAIPANVGLAVAIGVVMFSAHVGGTSLAAYSRQPAPAFRLLDDMSKVQAGRPPVLGMDRREAFDLRKAMQWVQTDHASGFSRTFQIEKQLPSPPQHEWFELARYWNGGGRAPVWFIADPKRTDIDLVQHGKPATYRWDLPYPVLIDGVRPNEMDWYRFDEPEWYVGEGWALTPEAAGVSHADRNGLDSGPIDAWIDSRASRGTIVVGGRNLGASRTTLSVDLDGVPRFQESVAAGFFLHTFPFPSVEPTGRYVKLSVHTVPPAPVALEQFDASARRPVLGFGDGWHEREFNPETGQRWRWLSESGELQVVSNGQPMNLELDVESPRKYFSRPSTLRLRQGQVTMFAQSIRDDVSLRIPLPPTVGRVIVETDQTYVPAERRRRTQDRRSLGLRIFRCELVPVSSPGR